MEGSTVNPSETAGQHPIAPSESMLKKRGQLEPRSPGFVLRSNKCKTADFCEFADAHQFHAIRTFLSEKDSRLPNKEFKTMHRRNFSETSKHFKRILQRQRKLGESPELPVTYQRTSDGRKYGQIYNRDNNVSAYKVNNIERTAASKCSRKSKRSPKGFSKGEDWERPSAQQFEETKGLIENESMIRPRGQGKLLNCQDDGFISFSDSSTKSLTSRLVGKHVATSTGYGSKIPKPFIETPAIPLSPMKVSLEDTIDLSQPWSDRPSTKQHNKSLLTTAQTPVRSSEDRPTARDFANDGGAKFQELRAGQRRSHSPIKHANGEDTVAGESHTYNGFPSFRQKIEELQTANIQNKNPLSKPSASATQEAPPFPLLSPTTLIPEPTIRLKPSPIRSDSSKPLSHTLAELTTQGIRSDASSGVVSNAQSAIMVRGQTATGQYKIGNMRKPPMSGPAPTRALPSLPESHSSVGPSTPKASGSNQRIEHSSRSPAQTIASPFSPKKYEYNFFPSNCSSPKVTRPNLPTQITAAVAPVHVASPPSSPLPIQVERQGISFPVAVVAERTTQNPNVSALELNQWQQQRNERTAARKAQDLAFMKAQKATIGGTNSGDSEMENRSEQSKDTQRLPMPTLRYSDPEASGPSQAKSKPQDTKINTAGAFVALQSRESNEFTQGFSPIIVLAEQEPTLPPSRISSQKTHPSTASNCAQQPPNTQPKGHQSLDPLPVSRRPSLNYASASGNPISNPRPLSTHSLTSRVPTPFMHSLLRTRSSASHGVSSTHTQQELQASEIEARLVACEKKNVMLERAFMAVINAGAGLEGCMSLGEGGERLGGGEVSNDRDGEGGEEGLHVVLEDLLAAHLGEEERERKSYSSGA